MGERPDTWDYERRCALSATITRLCAEEELGQSLRSARLGTGDLHAVVDRHWRSALISVALESGRWRVARWRGKREHRLVRLEEAGHRPWALGLWVSKRLGQLLLLAGVGVGIIANYPCGVTTQPAHCRTRTEPTAW